MDFQKPANQQPINEQKTDYGKVIQDTIKPVTDMFSGVKESTTNNLNEFSNQPDGNPQFNFSNTIIAKFAFLILVLIVFMFLINLGIMLIAYFTTPSSNPYIIKGMIDGTYGVVIPQDPKQKNSVTLLRSNNQSKGIEFTWSTWLYINDLNNSTTKYQHIFNKGDNTFNDSNIAINNNSPGLYLAPSDNTLRVIMNTVNQYDTNTVIDVTNIPIRKWVHVAIRLQNTILDVYVNGTISNRIVLQNVPKQNYYDINVCQNGGFLGKLSNLRYYSTALNVFEINKIVNSGPTTTTSPLTADVQSVSSGFSYLSNKWFASKLK